MTTISFIHTADLHLDTPFKGLTSVDPDLAAYLKQATFAAFDNIVAACLREKVDFLLIAGDVFDSRTRSLGAQLKFQEGLRRLAEADIPVYFVCGNHDPAGSWLAEMELPDQAHQFAADQPRSVSFHKDNRRLVDIHGLSHATDSVADNLAAGFAREDDPAPLSIALLHGTIGPAGPHERCSPFTESDIRDKGFDYWALGHIHRQTVIRSAEPAIVYPGNPQGRDFGESGPRGCYHVTLAPGRPPDLRFISTQSICFETLTVDLSGETSLNRLKDNIVTACEAAAAADDSVSNMLRVRLLGRTPLHGHLRPEALAELTGQINEAQSGQPPFCRLDRVEDETLPDVDLDQAARGDDFAAEVLRRLDFYLQSPEERAALIDPLAEDFGNHQIKKELEPLSDEDYQAVIRQARRRLIDLLFTG